MAGSVDLEATGEASASTKGIFDFFGLPRELRNEVYGWLTQDWCMCTGEGDDPLAIEICIPAGPLAMPFTLCRQFKTEYEERFKHGVAAIFKDLGHEIWTSEKSLVGRLGLITKAEILLLAICQRNDCDNGQCGVCKDLEDHINWMEETFPLFERLKEVAIKIYKCQDNPEDASKHRPKMDNQLDRLTSLPPTYRIEIFPFYVYEGSSAVDGIKAYEANQTSDLVWTKDLGWQKQNIATSVDD